MVFYFKFRHQFSIVPLSSGPAQSQPRESFINLASILKPSLRPELQLRELCKALDQDLEIDDFTKVSKVKKEGTCAAYIV